MIILAKNQDSSMFDHQQETIAVGKELLRSMWASSHLGNQKKLSDTMPSITASLLLPCVAILQLSLACGRPGMVGCCYRTFAFNL